MKKYEIETRMCELIDYIKQSDDLIETKIMSDVEYDSDCFSLSGTMLSSNQFLYPIGCGFDVGCGVGVFKTNIVRNEDYNWSKYINNNTPFGINSSSLKLKSDAKFNIEYAPFTLGILETGNHFIEFRKKSESFNNLIMDSTDDLNTLYIIIHSGISKDTQFHFVSKFIALYKKYFKSITEDDHNGYKLKIPMDSPDAIELLKDFNCANQYAKENRSYIASQLTHLFNGYIVEKFDSPHDFIKRKDGIIHHYHGVQEYTQYKDEQIAYVLSGPNSDNYYVKSLGTETCVNHGSKLKKVNISGIREYSTFQELLKIDDFKCSVVPIMSLKPIIGCKKIGDNYEYTIY